jgi:hypothetical protein
LSRLAPHAPAAPLIPSVSHLAESAPVSDPLSPEEIVEMREHLDFLREYKDALRLRLNAAEDLMVNGRREPSDRGVCRHLLGKVDRTVIEGAVGREPMKSNVAGALAHARGRDPRPPTSACCSRTSRRSLPALARRGRRGLRRVVRRIDFEASRRRASLGSCKC